MHPGRPAKEFALRATIPISVQARPLLSRKLSRWKPSVLLSLLPLTIAHHLHRIEFLRCAGDVVLGVGDDFGQDD